MPIQFDSENERLKTALTRSLANAAISAPYKDAVECLVRAARLLQTEHKGASIQATRDKYVDKLRRRVKGQKQQIQHLTKSLKDAWAIINRGGPVKPTMGESSIAYQEVKAWRGWAVLILGQYDSPESAREAIKTQLDELGKIAKKFVQLQQEVGAWDEWTKKTFGHLQGGSSEARTLLERASLDLHFWEKWSRDHLDSHNVESSHARQKLAKRFEALEKWEQWAAEELAHFGGRGTDLSTRDTLSEQLGVLRKMRADAKQAGEDLVKLENIYKSNEMSLTRTLWQLLDNYEEDWKKLGGATRETDQLVGHLRQILDAISNANKLGAKVLPGVLPLQRLEWLESVKEAFEGAEAEWKKVVAEPDVVKLVDCLRRLLGGLHGAARIGFGTAPAAGMLMTTLHVVADAIKSPDAAPMLVPLPKNPIEEGKELASVEWWNSVGANYRRQLNIYGLGQTGVHFMNDYSKAVENHKKRVFEDMVLLQHRKRVDHGMSPVESAQLMTKSLQDEYPEFANAFKRAKQVIDQIGEGGPIEVHPPGAPPSVVLQPLGVKIGEVSATTARSSKN